MSEPTRNSVLAAMEEYRRIGDDKAFRELFASPAPQPKQYLRFEGVDYPVKHLWAASHVPALESAKPFKTDGAKQGFRALDFANFVLWDDVKTTLQFEEPGEYFEGERRRSERTYIMRNRRLVEDKMRASDYTCEACGFNFERQYGKKMGEGIIEIHHLFPLRERNGAGPTKLDELAALCANCHRVAHRRYPEPYTVEEIKRQFQRPSTRKNLSSHMI